MYPNMGHRFMGHTQPLGHPLYLMIDGLSHQTGEIGSLIGQKGDLGVNWRDEETFTYSIVGWVCL